MELIKQREKRTIRRKIAKNKFDNIINLSAEDNKGIRLLDEGTVVSGDESILFYIKKGTLEKYLSVLDDDFVGHINYGHSDFATDPILLGQFTKSDFSLEDIGDGRKALYVSPHFFDTYRLRDIQSMPFDIGVSVEMNVSHNQEDSENYGFPVVDELFIYAFAVVGDAGNVNSSGIRLGGSKLNLKSLTEALEKQTSIDLSALQAALGEEATEEESKIELDVETEDTEEVEAEEAEAEEVETEEEAEETGTEEVELTTSDVIKKVEELSARISSLEEENKTLSEKVESLETEKEQLSTQLSAKEDEEKAFLKAFKGLKLNVADPEPKQNNNKKSFYMDGIGE